MNLGQLKVKVDDRKPNNIIGNYAKILSPLSLGLHKTARLCYLHLFHISGSSAIYIYINNMKVGLA